MPRRRDWLRLAAIAILTTGVLSALIVAFQGNDLRQQANTAPANPTTSETAASSPETPTLTDIQGDVSRHLDTNPIVFIPNTANLTQRGQQAAEEIAELLTGALEKLDSPEQAQQLRCEVGGHVAANSGDKDAAQELSQDRAEKVADILVSAGIPPKQVSARGFGDTKPNLDGDDRRVEIVLSTLPAE